MHLPLSFISSLHFCTTQQTACSPKTVPPTISSPPAACRSWCQGAARSNRSRSSPRSRFPSCSQALAECCWTSCRQTCFTAVWTLYFFFIIIIPSIISSLASFSEPVLSRWKTSVPSAQMQQPMNQIGAYTNCKEHNVVDWQCFAFIGKQFCHHYNIQHTSEEPS